MIRIWNDEPIRKSDPTTTLKVEGHPRIESLLVPASQLKGWDGYTLHLTGEQVADPDPDAPAWGFEIETGWLILELRAAVAAQLPSKAHAAIWWKPGTGMVKSVEITHDNFSDDDLKAAGYALRRLHGFVRGRGKHPGDGSRHHDDDIFRTELDAAIRHVQTTTGRRNPDPKLVMRQVNYQKTRFYERVKEVTGKRWQDLAAEYEKSGIQRN